MQSLSSLKGLGEKRLSALARAGVRTLPDLLLITPSDWRDTAHPVCIGELSEGVSCTVQGIIQKAPTLSFFHGLSRVTCTLRDDTGSVRLVWYNQPWVRESFHEGEKVLVSGKIYRSKQGRLYISSPRREHEAALIAEYHSIPGIPEKVLRGLILQAVESLEECCPETLPADFRQRYALCERNYALRQLHFPTDHACLKIAQHRIAFEKLLLYQAALSLLRGQPGNAEAIPLCAADLQTFWQNMPFEPTPSQRTVLDEIAKDLSCTTAMHRMVQGDVGSGKTVLAFGALYLCCKSGAQAVLMAPTEVLARQHYQNAVRILEPLGIHCGLLTGSMRAPERRRALASMKNGEWQAVIGTHALLSNDVEYLHLSLIITDEQHRFGVRQRNILTRKAVSGMEPHVLVMSATPIPRSLALVLFGDLDLSVVHDLPPGRIPVRTSIVPESKREALYRYIIDQARNGRQTYIVCPLAEESESIEAASAAEMYERLTSGPLQTLRVGLTWGSQKTTDKEKTLQAFSSGQLDVLISTTVIEVGVDVPNATTMVIENAERFGLSTLHQLRGRVGRGLEVSWCFLMAEPNERLMTLCRTNDGFAIAEKDLQMRGPGEFIGTQQHGRSLLSGFHFDAPLLQETQYCIRSLEQDPSQSELLKSLHDRAEQMFEEQLRSAVLN